MGQAIQETQTVSIRAIEARVRRAALKRDSVRIRRENIFYLSGYRPSLTKRANNVLKSRREFLQQQINNGAADIGPYYLEEASDDVICIGGQAVSLDWLAKEYNVLKPHEGIAQGETAYTGPNGERL